MNKSLRVLSRGLTGLLLLLAGWVAAAPTAIAEEPTVVVVFDGSASMWGKPDGESKHKMQLARDALKSGLAKASPELRLGLVSYGHRRGGDCGDVEMIVKPAAGTGQRIIGILEKHNPRGRGPITAALKEAAKDLGPQSAPSSLILIHDDPDNCQADPCSALGDLRAAHPKVVVHVVSLAMKREDAQRMQCLTRPTGGTHAEAANTQQANAAIEGILKLALAGSSAPAIPSGSGVAVARSAAIEKSAPRLPPTTVKPGLQLVASLGAGSAPLTMPLRWRVRPARQSDAAPVYEDDAVAPFLELPAGSYTVEAQSGFALARTSVQLAAGEAKTLNVALGAGMVQLTEPGAMAPSLNDAVVTFVRTEPAPETVSILRGLVPEIALAPGSYQIAVVAGPLRFERALQVKAGERIGIDPMLQLGELDLQVVGAAGGPPLDGVLTTIFEDDPDSPQGRREVTRSAAMRPLLTLPAGSYSAVARLGATEVRERFLVRSGERVQRTMSLEIARVGVTARVPGRLENTGPVVIRLERLDDTKEISQSSRGAAQFDVPAGRYKLEARIGTGNARIERDLDLKAGSREQVVLEPQAGLIRLRLMEAGGGAPMQDVAWEIKDRTGRVVFVATESEARPVLLQGRYTVRAETRNRRLTRDVEVRSGEARSVDLTGQ